MTKLDLDAIVGRAQKTFAAVRGSHIDTDPEEGLGLADDVLALVERVRELEAQIAASERRCLRLELFRDHYGPTSREIEPEDRCAACGGSGILIYGSTATWHGGVGGQAMTSDVCNKCWGSGDKHTPWPSHALLKRAAGPVMPETPSVRPDSTTETAGRASWRSRGGDARRQGAPER